jgi:hypothetical protein
MHPRRALVAALAAASTLPSHAAQPFVPMAPAVNFVQGTAPGDDESAAIGGGAAYAWDTDTIYHTGQLSKFARGHEMGHALDDQVLSDGDRNFFTRLMGLSGPWRQGTGIQNAGKRSPDEIFADWYGNAVAGNDPSRSWDDAYATPPDPKDFHRFQQALARLGRRRSLPQYQR